MFFDGLGVLIVLVGMEIHTKQKDNTKEKVVKKGRGVHS